MAQAGKYGKVNVKGIPADERIVILRAQDVTAPGVIEHAAVMAEAAGSPKRHVDGLRKAAKAMRDWQAEVGPDGTKAPD